MSHGALVARAADLVESKTRAGESDIKNIILFCLLIANFVCLILNVVVACCTRATFTRASKKASAEEVRISKTPRSIWVSTAAQNRYHSSSECHHVKRSGTMKRLELCFDCANHERDKDE